MEYVFVCFVSDEPMWGFVIFGLSKTFGHLKDTQKAINERQRQMFVKRGNGTLATRKTRTSNATLTYDRCLNRTRTVIN